MAFGVQSTGFVSKTQDEILTELVTEANSEDFFGADFPTTPESAFGNLAQIISASLKDSGWDLAESVYNQFNRDKAEGKNLDDLAALIGISRLLASGSTGNMLFQGTAGGVVPDNTPISDNDGRFVLTTSEFTYNRTSCYQVRVQVGTLLDSTVYSITVDGIPYAYPSGTGATNSEIILGLQTAIGIQPEYIVTTEDSDETLLVTLNSFNNILSVAVSAELDIFQIGTLVNAASEIDGNLVFLADTLTNLSPVPVGTISVTNPQGFQVGRVEETDEELRLRIAERESTTGTATKPAIESSISSLNGISSVIVEENDTLVTDVNGVPPKAYETFVRGGDEDEIAQVIWETKPAGILTHGNVTKIIIDQNGDQQSVKFSRPTQLYATVNVTYSLYSEEIFPNDGEQQIAEEVVSYGNSLDIGEDIIPQRFNGKIFEAVNGIASIVTEIGLSNDAITPPISFTDQLIPVSETETVNFDIARVNVSI